MILDAVFMAFMAVAERVAMGITHCPSDHASRDIALFVLAAGSRCFDPRHKARRMADRHCHLDAVVRDRSPGDGGGQNC
jgi:hypothetical protein